MADSNNIRFDELFPDFDDNINKAIKNLDRLNQAFDKLFNNIKKEGEQLKTTFQKFDPGTKEFQEATRSADQYEESLKSIQRVQSQLNGSFSELKNKQEQLKKEQKSLDRSTKQGADRFDELQRELIATGQALNKLNQNTRAAARVATSATDSYDQLSAELGQLRRELKNLPNAFDQSTGAINKTNKRAVELQQRISKLDGSLKKFDKSIGESFRNVGNYQNAIKSAGKALGGLGIALAAGFSAVQLVIRGFKEALNVTREFGLTSAKVQAVSGATAEEFAALQQQAKDLGAATAFSASQVAELQLNLSKLGFTANQIQASTKAILDFAVATDSDLGRAAEVVASTLNAYNLEASEAARISDVAAKAFSSTALDIEKFSTAIAIVGPAAQASGISIERTTAILGKIVDAGIDASSAGTALRNVFIDIADKGITLEEAFEQINSSTNKLSKANELFGKRGAVVSKVIADNVEEIDTLTESFNNAEGAAGDAANIIGDTLDGDIKRLQSAFQGLILEGGGLNNLFRFLVQDLTGFLNLINDLFGTTKRYVNEIEAQKKATKELERELFAEQNTLKGLTRQLKEAGDNTDERRKIIDTINRQYKEYLPNLLDEKDSFEELEKQINAVSEALLKRIILTKEEENIKKALEESVEAVKEFSKSQLDLTNQLDKQRQNLAQFQEEFRNLQKELNLTSDDVDRLFESNEELNNSFDETSDSIAQSGSSLEDLDRTFDLLNGTQQQFNEETNTSEDRLTQLAVFIDEASKNIQDLERRLKDNNQVLDDFADTSTGISLITSETDRLLKLFGLTRDEIEKINKEVDKGILGGLTPEQNKDIKDSELKLSAELIQINRLRADEIGKLARNQKKTSEEIAQDRANIDRIFEIREKDARLRAAKERLKIINDAGKSEGETEQQFRERQLSASEDFTKARLDLEETFYKTSEDLRRDFIENEAEDLKDRQEKLKEIASNPVTEGVIEGFKRLNQIQNEEKRRQAQQIEDEEERQKALDQIAKKEFRRQLFISSITAFQQELSKSGDVAEASRKATEVLVAGTVAGVIAGQFYDGGYTGDGGKYEPKGIVHGGEFVINKEKTKELGLKGASMSDFDRIIEERKFNLSDIYENTSDKIIQITNESKRFEFNKSHAKMLADEIGKQIPDISPLFTDLDGHLYRNIQKQNVKEKHLYKNLNSLIKNRRVY